MLSLIQYYKMIGFKGTLPRLALSSDALEPIMKKAEEDRKSSQSCLDFFEQILKYHESRLHGNQKIVIQNGGNSDFTNVFNKTVYDAFLQIINTNKQLCEKCKMSVEKISKLHNQSFSYISNKICSLQQSLLKYKEQQQVVLQMSKKYYKIHKQMLIAIQLYKNSFTDVTLIYNMDQKTKRFINCEQLYRNVSNEHSLINMKCQNLFEMKNEIIKIYSTMQKEYIQLIQKIGDGFVQMTKQFMLFFQQTSKSIVEILEDFWFTVQRVPIELIFKSNSNQEKLQNFTSRQKIDLDNQLSIFVEYHSFLTQNSLSKYNTQINSYLSLIEQRLETKKNQNKRLYESINNYFKNLQKIQNAIAKDILINFQKKRKRLSECFGNRLVTFLKSINSVFQISTGVNQKTCKNVAPLLQSIFKIISEETKLTKLFSQQININTQRFFLKKIPGEGEDQNYIKSVRKQIDQKAEFLKHLILGFKQKIDKQSTKMLSNYSQIIKQVKCQTVEFHEFCDQYFQLYFGEANFSGNFQKYKLDIKSTFKKSNEFYTQISLGLIKNDKIIFDGQFLKVEDFKKLKKPAPVQTSTVEIQNGSQRRESGVKYSDMSFGEKNSSQTNLQNLFDDQREAKNAEFLKGKIVFKENQKLLKTISCALSEKISLQGKMYITSMRICFHSNFNSDNIFFGRTFIQFPKTDIKKIQKRSNALLLENAISFTTVNGEIFFSSISSRNEIYDLICKTFNFSLDQHVYEYDQNQQQDFPKFLIDLEEKDDIKFQQLSQRLKLIEKQLPNFSFCESAKIQIHEQGLNAFKFFKIFYLPEQIYIGNRKYENFLKYFKQLIGHRDLQIDEWNPPLSSFFNQSNIKQSAPLMTERNISATVPIANTGVPFMPKTAKSKQNQKLYFFSKHKFVLLSQISTTGAPYTDTFKVYMKVTLQSDDDGKCQAKFDYFVSFVKNTMMKSVVQSKTKEETTNSCKILANQFTNYFQYLKKKVKKGVKKTQQQFMLQIQQLNNQLGAGKEKINEMSKSTQLHIKELKKLKTICIFSIVLNFFLIFLFLM